MIIIFKKCKNPQKIFNGKHWITVPCGKCISCEKKRIKELKKYNKIRRKKWKKS